MAADVIDEVSHFLLTATTIVDGCANELKLKGASLFTASQYTIDSMRNFYVDFRV